LDVYGKAVITALYKQIILIHNRPKVPSNSLTYITFVPLYAYIMRTVITGHASYYKICSAIAQTTHVPWATSGGALSVISSVTCLIPVSLEKRKKTIYYKDTNTLYYVKRVSTSIENLTIPEHETIL
jgi:hypothetical protein